MNLKLTAAQPFRMRVIKQNADGSGVVEIPILTVGTIDLSKTSGGGEGDWDVTSEVLAEMAANFHEYPGPVPVGFGGHVGFGERSGPSEAFIDRLMVQGNALVAHVFVTAARFQEVRNGMWRGFSFEGAKDAKLPAKQMAGWFVYGGTFTNRPAADVVFALPESIAASAALHVCLGDDEAGSDGMSETKQTETVAAEATPKKAEAPTEQRVSLAFHESTVNDLQAEIASGKSRIQNLEGRVETLQSEAHDLRRRAAEAESNASRSASDKISAEAKQRQAESESKALREEKRELETRLTEQTKRHDELRRKSINAELIALRNEQIDAGVPPAFFEGMDAEPSAWLDANYKDIDALKRACASIRGVGPKVKDSKVAASDPENRRGSDPGEPNALEGDDAELMKRLGRQFGWKHDFSGVTTEAEARAIVERDKAKQAAQ